MSHDTMRISPLAGKPAPPELLTDIPALVSAYYLRRPDPAAPTQRVAFGTSGHRGSSLEGSFNEWHVLAITQAVCDYRKRKGVDGPLFLGRDTHALSVPAAAGALEVFAANGVDLMLSSHDEPTPTPAVSLAILRHNGRRRSGLADGVVITPSHNPPADGGYKYNPPHGGPADVDATGWIQDRANDLLEGGLREVCRWSWQRALHAATTHRHDYIGAYVEELGKVIDTDTIAASGLRMGTDPLGGAGVHYWARIAERYRFNLDVVSEEIDPTFGFMSVDWDGKIRMDPSSPYAMQRLIRLKDRYDIAFSCDTDYDRHGIVTPSAGLLPPNHYLAVMIDHLFRHRSDWSGEAAVGKTLVSSALIDRVAARLRRKLVEVPVGFKWFVDGLYHGSLGFGGEESAGASFLRRDGKVWTTDKDGMIAALLSAEIMARQGKDPGELYDALTHELGTPCSRRVEAAATPEQKQRLARLAPSQITASELAGEKIEAVLSRAPGNEAPIGGIKVVTASGWFAARPSGTEDITKIYAESFRDEDHLKAILEQAEQIVHAAVAVGEPAVRTEGGA